jgi:HemX protein
MTDRTFLWLAMLFYASGGVITLRRLRARGDAAGLQRWNHLIMACGFALHTVFLFMRGQLVRSCPLTTFFESVIFALWAAVLFYLLIGPAYRVSFLGAFTSPLVFLIGIGSMLALPDNPVAPTEKHNPWVEFHAAIAIVAYGAFALACVVGAMYLLQERQLKTRRLTSAFLQLPSIDQLDKINVRLVIMGFVMMTAGMVGGMISYRLVGHARGFKVFMAVAVWLVYAGFLALHYIGAWRGRRIAWLSVVSFVLVLVALWGMSLK